MQEIEAPSYIWCTSLIYRKKSIKDGDRNTKGVRTARYLRKKKPFAQGERDNIENAL